MYKYKQINTEHGEVKLQMKRTCLRKQGSGFNLIEEILCGKNVYTARTKQIMEKQKNIWNEVCPYELDVRTQEQQTNKYIYGSLCKHIKSNNLNFLITKTSRGGITFLMK